MPWSEESHNTSVRLAGFWASDLDLGSPVRNGIEIPDVFADEIPNAMKGAYTHFWLNGKLAVII